MSVVDYEDRIGSLVSRMTLEEKVSQLSYNSPAIPRLGIPAYNWWNECLHGVARAGFATVFPQAISMAATFDEDLVRQVASAVSDEARAKYNEAVKRDNRGQYWGLTFWTPNINIFRDPRWGRGQETWGEDPCLTGRMGLAFMRGLQGDEPGRLKTAACAKHFAVHSGPEKLRHVFNAVVSKKDLFETYLPAFKLLVDKGVESVMAAYNKTLGEPCIASGYLIKEILRGEWGFKGHVVSDCHALEDLYNNHKVASGPEEAAVMALKAGCDLNCGCVYPFLAGAHKKGLVDESLIDTALGRLLRTRMKLGMFDPPESDPYRHLGRETIGSEKHRLLALKTARECIVLLKNKNDLLPLDDSAKRIILLGPGAANPHTLLGNYSGLNSRLVTVYEGLVEKTRHKYAISLDYAQGCLMHGGENLAHMSFGELGNADIVVAVFGLDNAMEGEEGTIAAEDRGDRVSIELPLWQLEYLQKLKEKGKPVILVLTGGSPIAVPEEIADAIVFAWYPGQEGGTAVADIIFGDVNPSGKLPMTFPTSTDQLPPYEDYSLKGRTYRYMRDKPFRPFGFGLSYTSFCFDSVEISSPFIRKGGLVKVAVKLTNTGKRGGEEVVQIYIAKDKRREDAPLSSLRDFKRVFVAPSESAIVEFELPDSAFATINDQGQAVLEEGSYTIIAADAAPLPVSVEKGAAPPVSVRVELVSAGS
ncbi:MAG: glycoside hydrolase family 3 C-terminal domain-containing protein, partial [Treponema sp.]|jgi:beta-glucosidase|nr:glycoside hydrolase family 3 C-terminal domain-containing protein [Treponema sp.]